MMWTVCYWWHSGPRFVFNRYKHSVKLFVRHPGGVYPEAILRKEGVTQEYPLSMVIYGMRLSVLEDQIRGEYPILFQSWYTDKSSLESAGAHIKPVISRIEALGTACYFFIKPDKT